ncbi:MAG: FAD-dependent oxidoreductase [Clostridia bacterium]|nr:FAD-dependent oxidoreductase [Clostridia bacterium]
MKKSLSLLLALAMVLSCVSFAFAEGTYTPGTYEATGKGYSDKVPVAVKITVDENAITAAEIEGSGEEPFGIAYFDLYEEALIGRTDGEIDAMTNATLTRNGIAEAVEKALAIARGEAVPEEAPVAEEAAPAVEGAQFVPGTYEAASQGFGGDVKVKVTVDESAITAIEITGDSETPGLGGAAMPVMQEAYIGKAAADAVDTYTGATITSKAVMDAVGKALAQAAGGGEAAAVSAEPVAFTAGEYTATAEGYNGPTTVKVVFGADKIESIEIVSTAETAHVGDIAFGIMIPEMIEANGSGVDGVSGATFSTRALRSAVNDAAEQANCTNLDAFKAAKVEHKAQETMNLDYDVVIVGAGGAGIAAAAQAAQDGSTVLVIEKNAEVGGNTLVSGGQYQSVMPYLVWDPADPDATTGVYAFNGETYDKVHSVPGCINELKMILNWSEEPFDADYYKDHEFVAGDAQELSKHGVHAEYLPTLQALKAEIREYFAWAAPILASGKSESQLPLFSTLNLHIFQTYYGGLRPSADGSEWMYGNVDLVKQFIEGGQGLKEWLESQGSAFVENTQPTLIGALWYRENEYAGANVDFDGDGQTEFYADRWGSYFMAPMNTVLKADEKNQIMLRTTAKELIVEDGRVVGVKAQQYDGTEVIAKAKKGVILATGGYAANIPMVLENNVYWSEEYVTNATKTTNRSSLQGDGIAMAQAVGADVTGLGFTQMMPISWVDNGNLAFGGGNYACWINPTTGHRFVDEGSERDVLSLAEFRNGITINGTPGVFLEIYNATERIPGPPSAQLKAEDYEGRYYHVKGTVEDFTALFAKLEGVTADPAQVLDTVKAYDQAVMGQGEYPDVGKAIASRCIGNVEKNEDGTYNAATYDLEGADLIVRLMAPSTHHTMGGVLVDTQRHVIDTNGQIIPGLYAAGEVTGGIHGGNRLGGNAIVEIFVSGRTAAEAVKADNE